MIDILYKDESYKINGAIFEVSNVMGPGLMEKAYQEALEKEFTLRGIPFEREKRFKLQYKGEPLQQEYIADFVCYGKIVVELKTVDSISKVHMAQVINYLKLTGMKLGLLVNFSSQNVKPIRLLNVTDDEGNAS